MKFNPYDGTGTQEIMLMKEAIEEALAPKNESQLITVHVGEVVAVEGKYTGFSCTIPASYTDSLKVVVNEAWTITLAPGCIYQLRDGILFSTTVSTSRTATMSIAPNTSHAIQKFSVIDKLEFGITPASAQPMGIEFDLVLSK